MRTILLPLLMLGLAGLNTGCKKDKPRGDNWPKKPLKTVKDLARHQDIQTTVRYSHLAPHDYTAAIDAIQ